MVKAVFDALILKHSLLVQLQQHAKQSFLSRSGQLQKMLPHLRGEREKGHFHEPLTQATPKHKEMKYLL